MKNRFYLIAFSILLSQVLQAQVSSKIDQFAQFPGGTGQFYQYLSDNLNYPSDALRDSLTGEVFVEFKINADGSINKESAKVITGLSPSCDEEALRLIRSAPAWLPAKAGNIDVGQTLSFPVSFQILTK